MAKNVIITEDGHSKTISNAMRIRTALESGGTCDWIPKDDVPLQELTVTEDGVYNPDEGYYGFSQVTANGVGTVVEGMLIEKTVTKNGTYNITDESGNPYGYSKITVNVDTSDDDSGSGSGGGGSNPVVGKDEDGNDTMAEADDDGNIVMTALPTEIKVIIPPTKLEYKRYEEIDYSGISVYAYISKAVHWLGTTTTVISEGSSNNTVLIGEKNVTASVGDGILYAPDRTGTNDIQLVWDGTKWVKPDNYSAEKAVWKSDKYETGKIPFEELIFPMKRLNIQTDNQANTEQRYAFDENGFIATMTKTNHLSWSHKIGLNMSGQHDPYIWYFVHNDIDIDGEYEGIVAFRTSKEGSTLLVFGISDTLESKAIKMTFAPSYGDEKRPLRKEDIMTSYTNWFRIPIVYDNGVTTGRRIMYGIPFDESSSYSIPISYVSYELNDINVFEVLNSIIDKYKKKDYMVLMSFILPVQWKRPGDGKILETTFTAWMKDDGGDNNASGGNTRPGGPNIDVPQ